MADMETGETVDYFFASEATMARLRYEPRRPMGERWRLWFFGPNHVYDVQVIDPQLTGEHDWADAAPVVEEVEKHLAERYSQAQRRQVPTGTDAVAEWELA